MTGSEEIYAIAKWYTVARRFPQMIGRTADGARIPGGPYTYTQVFVGVGLLLVGLKTTALWAHFGVIEDGLLLIGVTWAATWIVGRIPAEARNPISVVQGVHTALASPSSGTCAGRELIVPRAQQARGRVTVDPRAPAVAQPASEHATNGNEPAPDEAGDAGPGRWQLTVSQRLLAGVQGG